MSAVEFAGLSLGHFEEDIWGDTMWKGGCGKSGEIGIYVNSIYNVSNKDIKKVFFYCVPCDACGDRVGKEVRCECISISSVGNGRFDEPDEDGLVDDYIEEAGFWERLWCAPTAKYVEITKVNVVYADGSKEEIDGKNIKFIDDEDSLYYKILEEKEAAEEKAEEERRKAEEERRKVEERKRKEAEERRKAEEKKRKEEEENRKNEERKSRGVVMWAGIIDPKQCTVKKAGNVTFYFQNRESSYLAGWESVTTLECLELPAGCKYVSKDCVKDISELVYPKGAKSVDLSYTDFSGCRVKKIVIPKEVKCIVLENSLGNVEEIEFEDPYGWGMKKSTRGDSRKAYEYICQQYKDRFGKPMRDGLPSLESPKLKKSAIGAFFERIF